VKGSTLQEFVKFHLLQASWGTKAFLVTCSYVTGSWLALSFCFGAFKSNDLAWHGSFGGGRDMDLIIAVVKRNCDRIRIFLMSTSTEADFVGRAESAIAIFLLPFLLTFNR